MEKAIEIYNSLSRPPVDALRPIQAGKLKGKTDINPQWRYKAMTEAFGLVGIGWKYEVQKLWTEDGAGGEKLAFAQVAVYIKDGDKWSEPIVGIGGSRLVALEHGSAVSNDEGYKMAVTDAFSTALKMLGVAADIYAGRWDGSKYRDETSAPENQPKSVPPAAPAPKNPDYERIKTYFAMKNNGVPVFSDGEIAGYRSMIGTHAPDVLANMIREELLRRVPGAKV